MRNLKEIIILPALLLASCSEKSSYETTDIGQVDSGMDVVEFDANRTPKWNEPKNHRETALTCASRDRVVGTSETCNDTECTGGDEGRCRVRDDPEDSPEYCTYDDCSADKDCGNNEVCECGNSMDLFIIGPGADENRCVPSNCRTDADCGSAFCKPSPDICGSGKNYGYFCTTQSDECLENSDCGNGICGYSVEQSLWLCDGCN